MVSPLSLKEFVNMLSIRVAECFFTRVGLFINEANDTGIDTGIDLTDLRGLLRLLFCTCKPRASH